MMVLLTNLRILIGANLSVMQREVYFVKKTVLRLKNLSLMGFLILAGEKL